MAPLPKKKHSRSRKGRRNAHDAIGSPSLSKCGGCQEVIQPHRLCPYCGNYKGRTMPGTWSRDNQLSSETANDQPTQTRSAG